MLPDKTSGQLLETTDDPVSDNVLSVATNYDELTQPDETVVCPTKLFENDKAVTDETSTNDDKTLDNVPIQDALKTTTTTETGTGTVVEQLMTHSQDSGKSGHAGELISLTDATVERVIGEISYSDQSNEVHPYTTLRDIPPDVSSIKLVETSSVVLDLPEFSQTLDTSLTNSTNGLSLTQHIACDTSNKDLSGSTTSESSQSKRDRLKSCIIKLTELSKNERDHWMCSSSKSVTTSSKTDANVNNSRYNMCARPTPTQPSVRMTGRKRSLVNYKEDGFKDL